jgi:hypothetical protein
LIQPPPDHGDDDQETTLNPHYTSVAWKYFKRESTGAAESSAEGAEGVQALCRLCLEFQNDAYPYKVSKGSTKSLLIHLLREHIQPEDEGVPVVELDDQEKLFETKSAERWAPKTLYEDFLQRKADENQEELDGGEPGFSQIRFRKKTVRW